MYLATSVSRNQKKERIILQRFCNIIKLYSNGKAERGIMTFSHGLKFKMIGKISLSTMYVLAINGMKICMCFTDVIIILR